MALPQPVLEFLEQSAKQQGVNQICVGDDLFKLGVLDSFALVDFITVLEDASDIKVPDSDVNPINFLTLKAIEEYVAKRRG